MTIVEFEAGGNFITARKDDGKVLVRCNFDYTDCRDDEDLNLFIARHGGPDAAAEYLTDAYNTATRI